MSATWSTKRKTVGKTLDRARTAPARRYAGMLTLDVEEYVPRLSAQFARERRVLLYRSADAAR